MRRGGSVVGGREGSVERRGEVQNRFFRERECADGAEAEEESGNDEH